MQWTLTQLRTFVAVAEQGTMAAAATRLGYTAGAVSQHMSALSRAVGSPVVSPRGRSVVLTEAGRALLPRARAVVAAERQAARAMRGASADTTVTVGVFGSASVAAMQPASQQLEGKGIDVQTIEVDVEEMQEAVASGLIDVGIGIDYLDARLPPRRGVHMKPVRRERLSVAVGPGGMAALTAEGREVKSLSAGLEGGPSIDETHEVDAAAHEAAPVDSGGVGDGAGGSGDGAGGVGDVGAAGSTRGAGGSHVGLGVAPGRGDVFRDQEILRRALGRVPWILPPADSTWGRAFRLACRELGVMPREKHLVTDSAVALAMASSGLGVTLATPYLMRMAPANVHILPRTICGSRDIVILTSTDAPLTPAARTVVDVLTDVFNA
ncbi:LysR family transcriptional regulator [Brevibacterium ravenspurgense]|uniref:LysR substrate-binding domain-containing protein n=1 Tax=Brevibacterium ravenspurgense TaxID=479117 RepID=UPI001EF29DCB|nr:LysR family transcriptional regulator [Brevibacterium ravenspurgense]MCG7301279.1 LysR family transcriptional regulator [Brevibacterium ravenspurgense]